MSCKEYAKNKEKSIVEISPIDWFLLLFA